MSLDCPTSAVYHTSVEQKLHSKNAAKVYRYGSPKIRDQLRDKCRVRMREVRRMNFNQRRLVDIAEEIDLDKVLREELAALENDLRLQEEIFKELRDEINDWFIQELEAEEASLISAVDNDVISVLCPICQQSIITCTIPTEVEGAESSNRYHCKCGISFNFPGKPKDLHKKLYTHIDMHEQKCDANFTFYLEPQSVGKADMPTDDTSANNLCAICDKCDYFYSF
ncbi:RIP-like protein [Eurosta solidaginis]|uniref:RIP-like protein n=1 Tax=Eurosta solidaginis TaxID=178769 RepID=UPI0035307461